MEVENRRSRQTGRCKEVTQNPITPETVMEEAHDNAAQMRQFDELKLNQFKDSKNSLVRKA